MQTILGAGGAIGTELAKALADSHTSNIRLVGRNPTKKTEPRYDQISLRIFPIRMSFTKLSPHPEDQGVWLHQEAWFHLAAFERGSTASYKIKNPEMGYTFLYWMVK